MLIWLRKVNILMVCFTLSASLSAQRAKGSLSGVVCDSIIAAPPNGNGYVSNATLTLMRQSDSSLVAFTMTDTVGKFILNRIPEGKYRLLITHPGYHSRSLDIAIAAATPNLQLPPLWLTHRSIQLNEVVIIESTPPVTLNGDTLEFNASSFRTLPNASVEELLKKLPGVKINADGTFMVNGKKVTRILVDGKDFFADDPTLASQNIPADAVKKVQVFQKASDTQEVTGVDDGNSETTINLSLKEDKKRGGFGTFTGAAGTDNRYKTGLNYNRFNDARRVSMIANTNNINERVFTVQDMVSMSGGVGNAGEGGGRMFFSDESGGQFEGGQQTGINTNWASGINYNDDWGKYIQFSARYFYTHRERGLFSTSFRNYILEDSTLSRNSISESNNYHDNHRVGASFEYKPDTLTRIRLRPLFSYSTSRSFTASYFESRNNADRLFNEGQNNNFTGRDFWTFSNVTQLTKKMRKQGRSFSFFLNTSLRSGQHFSEPDTRTLFYEENIPVSQFIRKQRNNQYDNRNDQQLTLNWSEPVGKYGSIIIPAIVASSQIRNDRDVFNKDSLRRDILIFDNNLSNDFAMTFRYLLSGLGYYYDHDKHTLSFDLRLQGSELIGNTAGNSIGNTSYSLNLIPHMRYRYELTTSKSILLSFFSEVVAPEIMDLNPLRDITDPLIVISGNLFLKPEQHYRSNLQWNSVDLSSGRSFVFNLLYTYIDKPVVKSNAIDDFGRQVTQSINGIPKKSWSIYMNYSRPIEKLKSAFDIDIFTSIQQISTPLNGFQNENLTIYSSPTLGWRFQPTDSFEIAIKGEFSFSDGRYSLTPEQSNLFVTQQYHMRLMWQTRTGLLFESTFEYIIAANQKNSLGVSYPLWTASLAYGLLKDKRGEVKLSVFDILNSNTGITQTVQPNYVQIMRYNTLRRYGLLSFTYRLGDIPKRSKKRS